jgi:6,7-dimethyl-8-ribityllumazine synthase
MPSYTVFLTKGTYVVDESDAERIRSAVASGAPFVEVGVDLRCDGATAHRAEIATAHVVTLVRVPDAFDLPHADARPANVRRLFSAF